MADKEDDDLLKKADALMKRRRVFVAGASEPSEEKAAPPADNGDDDVPLLTDVVGPDVFSDTATAVVVDLATARAALAAELEAWLDDQLPAHVQHVLDGITDQLILQLAQKARGELLPKLQALIAASRPGAQPPQPHHTDD